MNDNKAYVFITTLEHLPWGGCEDLWFKTALLALEDECEVYVLAFRHEELPEHLKRLSEKGAKLFFFNKVVSKSSIIKRIFRKIVGVGSYRKILRTVSNNLSDFASATIIISQAGGFDFTYDYLKEVYAWLISLKINYHVVVQNVPDLGFTLPLEKLVLQKVIYEKAKSVGFVSIRNKQSSERILAGTVSNGYFINNPLNLPQAPAYIPFPTMDEAISFGVVAAFNCSHKGQDVLLQVLSDRKWWNRKWKLNLYGKGKDKEYLITLAKFYKIEDRVFFHGHVNDILEIWKVNHIHILPSLGEGTPLALIESMVCGRPVVTTDVGGNCEYVSDTINGFVFDFPTFPALDRILEIAWQNQEHWEEMGRFARKKILTKYDLNPQKKLYKIDGKF